MKEKTRRAYQYIISQLKETSTWRGIILLLTGCGMFISEDLKEAIMTIGLSIAGLLAIIFPDKVNKDKE